jgi:hypothetical protein
VDQTLDFQGNAATPWQHVVSGPPKHSGPTIVGRFARLHASPRRGELRAATWGGDRFSDRLGVDGHDNAISFWKSAEAMSRQPLSLPHADKSIRNAADAFAKLTRRRKQAPSDWGICDVERATSDSGKFLSEQISDLWIARRIPCARGFRLIQGVVRPCSQSRSGPVGI